MTDLFEAPANDQNAELDPNQIFETLVGEGKKFKTPQELAKAKYESDRFIEQLKRETAGLREELNARVRLEEVVDKFASRDQNPPASTPNNQQDERGNDQSALTPDKIAELVAKTVQERETARIREQNIAYVRDELTKALGSDYVTHLNRTASELGLSQDQVRDLAGNNPKALLKLVGAETASPNRDPLTPPRSSVQQPLGRQETGLKTKAYYDNIKRTDPSRYWSPAVQNEMHKEALRLGERFFT